MTLFDGSCSRGRIVSVGGDEKTHRWLVDNGLVGLSFSVKARSRSAVLVEFGHEFTAAVCASAAKQIHIVEG